MLAGVSSLAYHGSNKKFFIFNVAENSGSGGFKETKSTLLIHVMLMALSWGCLLPLGGCYANLCRHRGKKGDWFKLHKATQYSGWMLQIIGFVCAVLYVGDSGSTHFRTDTPHMLIGSNPPSLFWTTFIFSYGFELLQKRELALYALSLSLSLSLSLFLPLPFILFCCRLGGRHSRHTAAFERRPASPPRAPHNGPSGLRGGS